MINGMEDGISVTGSTEVVVCVCCLNITDENADLRCTQSSDSR